jgi:hypothetical protein
MSPASRRRSGYPGAVIAALALASLTASSARAEEHRPSTRALVATGALLSVPTYFLGVALHEGSHAVTARAFGATITGFRVLPGRHHRTGAFSFGYTSYRGVLSRNEKALFFLSPKLTNLVMLGGYASLVGLDALPDNAYAQLGLAVLATGAWVDFSKDVLAFRPENDLLRFHALYGREREWQRLPYRVLHAGVSLGAAYVVWRGYARLFDTGDPPATAIVPLALGRF